MAKNIFFLIFLVLCGICPLQSDTIITETTSYNDNIVITKETFDKVWFYFKVDTSRTPQSVPTGKIKKIIREEPIHYQAAEGAMKAGAYQRAAEAYERCAQSQDWTEQHCLFKIGLCYQNLGRISKAVDAYERLLKKFPDTFYKAQASFNIGHCYMAQKKWRSAYEALSDAAKLYEQIEQKDEWLIANYWIGFVGEKGNQHKLALDRYGMVIRQGKNLPEWTSKAKLRSGFCYLETKDHQEAKRMFLSLIEEVSFKNQEIIGGAYTGMGGYYFATRKIKEALLCYLRVIMLYSDRDEYAREAYAKAAYCFELLKDENPEYQSRAQALKQMAAQKFRN